MKKLWLVLGIVAVAGIWTLAFAQTTAIPWQTNVIGLHTACVLSPVTTPPTAAYCFASDGLWVSINGAAYTQLGAGTALPAGAYVESWKGRTGKVVPIPSDYPDAVSSVNNKTGAVVLTVQ